MMEEQIVSAVQIAFDQNPAADQNLKSQAFEYVNQLRAEPSAWQPCLNVFTKIPRHHDVVRFFALEIVNKAVEGGTLDERGTNTVKQQLMTYLERSYKTREGLSQRDETSVENKIAQTVTLLFSTRYASGWETIFDDLLSLTNDGQPGRYDRAEGTVFYLRVLNSIHDEIGEQSLARTVPEQDRATLLKDLIRRRDVQKISQSWQAILTQWGDSNDIIAELTLKAVGKWVSWIDISLIVNRQMLELLFQQLARAQQLNLRPHEEKARDAAIDAFTEITGKKMKTSDKLEMITFLNLDRVVSQLIACPPLSERRGSSQYDTDLAETVAKLVNVTVVDIVRALETESEDLQVWQRAEVMLQAFLPHVLRFFSDEYDEVCSTVIPSLNDVLSFLRRSAKDGPSSPQRAVMLLPILRAVFAKMRYDETATWEEDEEQEDEAEFQDLRKRLDILQQTISGADEQLYSDAVTGLIEQTFDDVQTRGARVNWRDLELALHEMFLFGDLAIKTGGLYQKNKPNSPAAEKLVQMLLKMMECDVASFDHPATQLHYMNICVRYGSFFEKHTQYITSVLENFLKLVHHPVMKVRTKAWYLFQRYVRLLRSHVGPLAETVIRNLSDLLIIKAEAPPEANGDDMSSEDLESSADTIFTSQLYLFEAVGSICGANSVPIDKQVHLCQSVMLPTFSDMEQTLPAARLSDECAILQIHHDIMALGTLARGFSDWASISTLSSNPPAPEVQAVFGRVAEATLVALESLKTSINIRTAARFAFSRLIAVLGSQILPQLPRWIDGLLAQSSTNDEVALFLRLLDQVIFAFKTNISEFLDSLFTGLLQRVYSGLNKQTMGTDDEIQLAELKREYLNFLLVILNNDLGSVIVSSTNQPFFDTLLGTIEHFTKDEEDYPTAKMAFQVLVKMCSTWGGPDVVTTVGQTNGTAPVPQPALPGLDRFMITRFSPLCWALPATGSFNSQDAQARLVLGEAANLQKIIYSKTGQEYLSWLRDNELRSMGMSGDMINEYLGKMTHLGTKDFRTYFQTFVGEAGSA